VSDIFQEVEEEVRKEQYAKLWKKYGVYIVAAAVGLVIAVAGYQAWGYFERQARIEDSQRYAAAMALLESGETQAAAEQLSAIVEDDGGYATLASFRLAGSKLETGDREAGLEILRGLAEQDAGEAFGDAARLLVALHELDNGDPETLRSWLEPLLAEDNAFRPSALELTAILAQREGDLAKARELYQQLADDLSAPNGVRSRATSMLAVLGE
jgi:hypothetical protein